MALGPGDKEQAEIPDEIDPRWAALLQLRGDDDDSNSWRRVKGNGTASKTKSQQRPAQSPPLHDAIGVPSWWRAPIAAPDDAASRCPTCGYYKGRQIIDVDAE
ncbi:MAG: hypothetical protein R3A10_10440 [Caldilineaceae bacterium]